MLDGDRQTSVFSLNLSKAQEIAEMESKVAGYKKAKTGDDAPPPPPPPSDAPPLPVSSPGFLERFATQLVKNVQLVVKRIHVRFEDRQSNPDKPFTAGLSLGRLVQAQARVRANALEPARYHDLR